MVLQLSSHSQQHQAVNHLSLLEGAKHHSREREQFGVIKVITGLLKKSIGTYQLANVGLGGLRVTCSMPRTSQAIC